MAKDYTEQEKRNRECRKICQDNWRGWITVAILFATASVAIYGIENTRRQFRDNQRNMFVSQLISRIAASKQMQYEDGKEKGWTTTGTIENEAAYNVAVQLVNEMDKTDPWRQIIIDTLRARQKEDPSVQGYINKIK